MTQLERLTAEARRLRAEIDSTAFMLSSARDSQLGLARRIAGLEASLGVLTRAYDATLAAIAELKGSDPDENPYVELLGEEYAWTYDFRHRDMFGTQNMIVAKSADYGENIHQALRAAREALQGLDMGTRADTQVIVLLSADTSYNQLWLGYGSRWGSDYVHGDIFDCAGVHIVAPEPTFETYLGMDDAAPRKVVCRASITSEAPLAGGSMLKVSRGSTDVVTPAFGRLHLWGVEVMNRGRSSVSINTGQPFIYKNTACSLTMDPRAAAPEETGEKWGMQLYQCSPDFYECYWDLPGIKEHPAYVHGHAPNHDIRFVSILSTACGGQVMQFTEREYEAADAPADLCLIDNCVLTGFAKDASRASKAITFAGAGLVAEVLNTVVVDDDPTDTEGQSANREGTSYGCFTVWSPTADEQSYRNENGYANEFVRMNNVIMAVREPNRSIASFSDCEAVDISKTWFMTAGGGTNGWPQANYKEVDVGQLDYDGSEDPDQVLIDRANAIMQGRLADYERRGIRAMNGQPGSSDIQPAEVGQILGRLSPFPAG